MIELYLHVKIFLDYFPGRPKYTELGKSMRLTFWIPVPKVVEIIPYYTLLFYTDLYTKPYHRLRFNQTHLPLFQNMSVKFYTIFFLSSGVYNFKINCLKNKMRHEIWVLISLKNWASFLLQREYYFWHRRSKRCEKFVKLYPEIFEIKVFVRSNN